MNKLIYYLTLPCLGSMFLPEDWPANDGFFSTPFIAKLLLMPIWVKLILAKYLSMWLMAEGICAVSGLSYVGLKETDSGPKADWTGCANVKLRRLESAQKFGHYIEAFNINTNSWVMNYVYKRLKFMNNRYVSQLSALVFLAVWHGWHSGYYLTFFNEFIVINFEKEWASVWAKSGKIFIFFFRLFSTQTFHEINKQISKHFSFHDIPFSTITFFNDNSII